MCICLRLYFSSSLVNAFFVVVPQPPVPQPRVCQRLLANFHWTGHQQIDPDFSILCTGSCPNAKNRVKMVVWWGLKQGCKASCLEMRCRFNKGLTAPHVENRTGLAHNDKKKKRILQKVPLLCFRCVSAHPILSAVCNRQYSCGCCDNVLCFNVHHDDLDIWYWMRFGTVCTFTGSWCIYGIVICVAGTDACGRFCGLCLRRLCLSFTSGCGGLRVEISFQFQRFQFNTSFTRPRGHPPGLPSGPILQ